MLNYDYWMDNFGIFYANLTWFHIISMILSWLALLVSSWSSLRLKKKQRNIPAAEETTKELTDDSLQTQYKLARQKLVEQELTPEQRYKEKEAEAQQLAVILKLLQEKSDTFQVASMDELEDQLRLYRK